ncbi:hotdog family protein [Salinactinospora qingdaonensis]|uniref:3-hydroxyacyl-[acyl-carrier-protein] dehydratase n=1 Tax=Salinactinospora qingdaonensis TaxID=702744 RepID=A0ABP7FEK8_9ACTN
MTHQPDTASADPRMGAAPLRAVDDVAHTEAHGHLTVRATKEITATDPYMAGHFPGEPVYPGIFAVESLRQAVLTALSERDEHGFELTALRSVRFTSPLLPGDTLRIEATLDAPDPTGTRRVSARLLAADDRPAARISADFTREAADD